MKKLYLVLIAVAFFIEASAQRNISFLKKECTDQQGYNSIILLGNKIIWVFNDVGNVSTNRNGNNPDEFSESLSQNFTSHAAVQAFVYPIPAEDHLNFSFDKEINSGVIVIYDISGKIISANNFSGNHTTISCSDFSRGFYFYDVKSGGTVIANGKFIRN